MGYLYYGFFYVNIRWFLQIILLKDDNGKFWCSTKVDDAGAHIGGKGYWGHCEKWSYSISCKFGLIFGKIQSYLNNKLGVSGMKITADDQTQFQILPRYFKTNLFNFDVCITYSFDNFLITTKTTAPRMNFPRPTLKHTLDGKHAHVSPWRNVRGFIGYSNEVRNFQRQTGFTKRLWSWLETRFVMKILKPCIAVIVIRMVLFQRLRIFQ